MLIYACTLSLDPKSDRRLVAGTVANWLRFKNRTKTSGDDLLRGAEFRLPTGSVTTALTADDYPELWALRYEHADSAVSGRQWVTDIGTRRARATEAVECTVVVRTNEVSARVAAPVTVSRPTIVRDLAEACGALRTPGLKLQELEVDSADAFAYGLDNERRNHSYVVVSPTVDGTYLVDRERLRSLVIGLADVVVIPVGADTFLLQRILGKRFAVWGGAINVIFPIAKFPDGSFVATRRLMPDDLEQLAAKGVQPETELLSILTHRTNLPISWRAITVDRVREFEIRRTLATRLAEAKNRGDQTEYIELLEEDNSTLNQRVTSLEGRVNDLEEDIESRDSEIGRLRYELDTMRAAEAQTDASSHPVAAAPGDVLAVLSGTATPYQSLALLSTLFPDRLVVLTSAWKSAKKSDSFRYRKQAFDLLWKLVAEYAENLEDGKGDAEARRVFGLGEFAAKESNTVENNPAARRRRTFDYLAKPTAMTKHLKIGVKDSAAETLRVHFHWDASAKRIVIGHCGPHLDFD